MKEKGIFKNYFWARQPFVCIFHSKDEQLKIYTMKQNVLKLLAVVFLLGSLFIACDDDDNSSSSMKLSISGLEDLGSDYLYEGWLITDNGPVTSGTFSVDENGNLSKTAFDIDPDVLQNANAFVLTIEPSPDNDPSPSEVHILAGSFDNNEADLTINHPSALKTNFSSAIGNYIIATPTDGMGNNENSGIWFLDASSGSPEAGLDLPSLPAGWVYEGWVVVDGTPITTGTFTSVSGSDNNAPFSGNMAGPPFPGEDFLNNAPEGIAFPLDLAGSKAVISVEPVPDNSAAPFLLKPLVGNIPSSINNGQAYAFDQNLAFPTGKAVK